MSAHQFEMFNRGVWRPHEVCHPYVVFPVVDEDHIEWYDHPRASCGLDAGIPRTLPEIPQFHVLARYLLISVTFPPAAQQARN